MVYLFLLPPVGIFILLITKIVIQLDSKMKQIDKNKHAD